MAYFILGVLSLWLQNSSAETLSQSCEYLQSVESSISFSQVEMVARDHHIGLYHAEDIVLSPWIQVSEKADLGIDKKGRVLLAVQLVDRKVAFLLSGGHQMHSLFLRKDGILIAIDHQGDFYQFGWAKWANRKILPIVRRSLQNWGAANCSVVVLLGLASFMQQEGLSLAQLGLTFGVVSAGSAMIEAFKAAYVYEKQNLLTNGFHRLNTSIHGLRRAESQRSCLGLISDYTFATSADTRSLNSLLEMDPRFAPDMTESLDWKAEYETLPRGIPEAHYSPERQP